MTRTAPAWFVRWLRERFPDRRVAWNSARECWEIQKRVRDGCMDFWETELTWPHWNIGSQLCDKLVRGAWFQRGERFKDFWRRTVVMPESNLRRGRVNDYERAMGDFQKEAHKCLRRDVGKTVTLGAIKNERIGN